jgi:hypothetical protein
VTAVPGLGYRLDHLPAAQAMHRDSAALPVVLAYLPFVQLVHPVDPLAPSELYLPAGQS